MAKKKKEENEVKEYKDHSLIITLLVLLVIFAGVISTVVYMWDKPTYSKIQSNIKAQEEAEANNPKKTYSKLDELTPTISDKYSIYDDPSKKEEVKDNNASNTDVISDNSDAFIQEGSIVGTWSKGEGENANVYTFEEGGKGNLKSNQGNCLINWSAANGILHMSTSKDGTVVEENLKYGQFGDTLIIFKNPDYTGDTILRRNGKEFSDNSFSDSHIGTWKSYNRRKSQYEDVVVTFYADGTGVQTTDGKNVKLSWTRKSDVLTITFYNDEGGVENKDDSYFGVNGNTLEILTGLGQGSWITYIKQ